MVIVHIMELTLATNIPIAIKSFTNVSKVSPLPTSIIKSAYTAGSWLLRLESELQGLETMIPAVQGLLD